MRMTSGEVTLPACAHAAQPRSSAAANARAPCISPLRCRRADRSGWDRSVATPCSGRRSCRARSRAATTRSYRSCRPPTDRPSRSSACRTRSHRRACCRHEPRPRRDGRGSCRQHARRCDLVRHAEDREGRSVGGRHDRYDRVVAARDRARHERRPLHGVATDRSQPLRSARRHLSGLMHGARAFAAALLLGCAACAQAGSVTSPDVIRMEVASDPPGLNPLVVDNAGVSFLAPLIHGYLMRDDGRGRLIPDLAEVVPTLANGGISRDGLTVTYHLRRDARWHDGVAFDAGDVVFSFVAAMNKRNTVPDRTGFDHVRSVRALDPHTVRVRLTRPFSPFVPSCFTMAANDPYPLLPAHLLRGKPDLNRDPYNAAPVGLGPYTVRSGIAGRGSCWSRIAAISAARRRSRGSRSRSCRTPTRWRRCGKAAASTSSSRGTRSGGSSSTRCERAATPASCCSPTTNSIS